MVHWVNPFLESEVAGLFGCLSVSLPNFSIMAVKGTAIVRTNGRTDGKGRWLRLYGLFKQLRFAMRIPR